MYLKALRYAGGWLCHILLKGISWFLSGGIRLNSHKAGLGFIKESNRILRARWERAALTILPLRP